MSSRSRAVPLALALLPALGCSWLAVTKPPSGPIEATPPLACTSDVAAPVTDTVVAGLLAVGGLVALANTPPSCSSSGYSGLCSAAQGVVVGGGVLALGSGVVFAFSAGHGYSTTAECRHLKEAQLSCTSVVEETCRTLQDRKPK